MKKIPWMRVLLITFFISFGLNILVDGVIFYDFFDPCRVYMNKCGDSFTFNLVHSTYFLRSLGVLNFINVLVSGAVIYKHIRLKKGIYIVFGVISILLTFSIWLLFMGELGIIFS